tara:strand:- start:1210 stop:2250 length:1041 start_codon:yes stop_codon:yes gene_type:complete
MRFFTILQILKINLIIFLKKIFVKNAKIKPYKILINLTDLCNSRCSFCDIWKIKPQNEIILENIQYALKGMEDDVYWISFSGGEVTLVKYFYDLVDYLKTNCKNLRILAFTTNALAPNRAYQFAKYCKDLGFDTLITISLDGNKEIHDKIRGINGNYEKCLSLKNKLDQNDIQSHYGLTVSETNSDLIIDKFDSLPQPIKAYTFVHSEGIYNKVNDNKEDDKILKALEVIYKNYKINKIYEIIEKIHIKICILFLKSKRQKNIIPCDVLNSSIHIMPNGDLKPCMFMKSCGNIKTEKIDNILQSDLVRQTKKEIKENNCPKCWMNCYSPHSIMQYPFRSILKMLLN